MTQRGSFVYRNAAEDSATAEISRSQIWQWVRHGLRTEEGQQVGWVWMLWLCV